MTVVFDMIQNFSHRALSAAKSALPQAVRTSIWVVKITLAVSFAILFLKYLNIVPWINNFVSPVFRHLGLPGEASLAFLSGYFTNVYTAIAVAVSLDLDVRTMTILGVMALCAHNMITETLVQKKTGTNAWWIAFVRTAAAFVLAAVLNLLMGGEVVSNVAHYTQEQLEFIPLLKDWAVTSFWLVLKMVTLIISLSILQKLLNEFGIIAALSKILGPVMSFFGLGRNTAFLWIVANTLGLAYGAAIMIDEAQSGNVSKRDIDYLNTHICSSHSNLEDLFLISSVGAIWWIVLLSRWCFSFAIVWLLRAYYFFRDKKATSAV